MPAKPNYTRDDFDHSPLLVFYETTRACDLMCKHCRADAQRDCDPNELSTPIARRLIHQLTEFPKPPLLVFTGGDPIKRRDIFDLVEYAASVGLKTAMTPSATPLVTPAVIQRLANSGLHRLAVSLDGANAQTHDAFRQVPGSFQRTLEVIEDASSAGLPVQVNTTIARHNMKQVDDIAVMLATMHIELWSVFFLIPTGRGQADQRLNADEIEHVFRQLYVHQRCGRMPIKTTQAPHFRRFVLQQARGAAGNARAHAPGAASRVGTNDGKGVLFVSHTGEIFPSGFLPLSCGQFPFDSIPHVYQQSALFKALRDADRLGGKCGVCEYRNICGGSRARSFSVTNDPLASEPDCAYIPPKWDPAKASEPQAAQC